MNPVAALTLCLALFVPVTQATTVASDAEVLAATATLQQLLPPARTFTVATAGTVQIQASDLGTPAALSGLQVAVSKDGARVAGLGAAGTVQFAAVPGVYKVQALGSVSGTTPGSFTVDVRVPGAAASLLTFSDAITPPAAAPADPATTRLDDTFTVAQAGSYTITVTDLSLPVALSSIDLIVLQGSTPVTVPPFSGQCTPTCTKGPFVLAAGSYDIGGFVTAGGADKAGLYSLTVSGGPAGTAVYSRTLPVGQLPAARSLTLAAGAGTLSLNDFGNPVALSSLQARVVQGATLLGSLGGAGQVALNAAAAGPAQLFVFTRAGGTAGTGAYGLKLAQGSTTVLEDARPLPEGYSSTAGIGGYRFSTTIPNAGAYTLQLSDYAFPANFTALRGLVVQGGVQVQAVSGAGSATATLSAGPAQVLVFGAPATATSNSLFGLSLTPQSGTVPVLEQAQGVGGLFRTFTVTIGTPGSYDLSLNDLQVPAAFGELALALTQGPALKGQIFGGGRLTFSVPTGGVYSLNVLARLGAGASYGSYGYLIETTPPAPAITFTSTPAAVASGQTTTLQWSVTDATSCTASDGWTGQKATTGTEASPAVTAATTYTLACTGRGGRTSQSVNVTIASSSGGSSGGGGGGGSLDLATFVALSALLILRAATRRAHDAPTHDIPPATFRIRNEWSAAPAVAEAPGEPAPACHTLAR